MGWPVAISDRRACVVENRVLDSRGGALRCGLVSGDRVPVRYVCRTADVQGVDGPVVPRRLGGIASAAGSGLLRMGHAGRVADATVRLRPNATSVGPREAFELDSTKAARKRQAILSTILTFVVDPMSEQSHADSNGKNEQFVQLAEQKPPGLLREYLHFL